MEYTLIRSKRRRRSTALTVSRAGEVVVRAPYRMPRLLIDSFVSAHETWINKRRLLLQKPRREPRVYFTKIKLQAYINAQLAHYAPLLRLYPSRVRLTSATSYWGSCSPRDLLSFSSRLTLAPPEAVAYVVVHELCHLRHRGHGAKFWTLVNATYPKANEMRQLLRQLSL